MYNYKGQCEDICNDLIKKLRNFCEKFHRVKICYNFAQVFALPRGVIGTTP